ncbi:MAG: Phosphate transporter [Parcubacteria group bacterium GW2011_GWA2_39_18]|nr:MAG: Phosphate transporter [Parcubacteria group bacterium GW2011_GWA2_39_18]
MELAIISAIIVVVLALFFDFTNGFHDSANQVATVIASRALSPAAALIIAAMADFIGAYFFGTAVAETLGKGIVDPRVLQIGVSGVLVIIGAICGAILWNIITWYFGMPSSSSHALIGGLVGAFVVGWGFAPIHWLKVFEIILIMVISPLVGFGVSYFFTRLAWRFAQWSTPKANEVFKKLQIFSLVAQGISHGTNDAQKTMGVITFSLVILGLYSPGSNSSMSIPSWVVIICSLALSLGTIIGGWRIIKTLGAGLYKIRSIHGFVSQIASSAIMYLTATFGFPISTTQVISSSIMGAGAATRIKMVRWQVAKDMAVAWLITMPSSAVLAGTIFYILNKIF